MPIINSFVRFSVQECRANPEYIYIFGDNRDCWGKLGQAIIRDEPNALGIPTKYKPSMHSDAFFTDRTLEDLWFQSAIDKFIEITLKHLDAGKTIIIPGAGIGTGLAQLPIRAPKVYQFLLNLIKSMKEEYGN